MMLPVNMNVMGDLLEALIAATLLIGACVQWIRYRHCAYHIDTGYWMMLAVGFFFITVASLGEAIVYGDMFGTYVALTLKLVGYLAIVVALLRLFSWNAHRHTETS